MRQPLYGMSNARDVDPEQSWDRGSSIWFKNQIGMPRKIPDKIIIILRTGSGCIDMSE